MPEKRVNELSFELSHSKLALNWLSHWFSDIIPWTKTVIFFLLKWALVEILHRSMRWMLTGEMLLHSMSFKADCMGKVISEIYFCAFSGDGLR